jgi:hypothetical protein
MFDNQKAEELARLHNCRYVGPQEDLDGHIAFHLFNDRGNPSPSTFAAKTEAEFFFKLDKQRRMS